MKASHRVVTYRDGQVIYFSPVVSYQRAAEIAVNEVKAVALEMALLWPTYEYDADLWLWLHPTDDQKFTEVCIKNIRYESV